MLEDLYQVTLSIKFNHSEDSQCSDLHSSPERQKSSSFMVKCFNCYGKQKQLISKCKECNGKQYISSEHPMSVLMNEIINKKLINCKDNRDAVYTIKEEQEDLEDKKNNCHYCQMEIQKSKYSCPQCPTFFVCDTCETLISQHQHKLTKNLTFSDFNNNELSTKQCFSCHNQIFDCYTKCVTCEQKGINYWICDQCTDSQNYTHNLSHNLITSIYSFPYKQLNIETVSQEYSQSSEQQVIEQNQEFHDLKKKNSSIANYLQESIQLIKYQKQFAQPDINIRDSQIKIEVEGLFSSYQFSEVKNSLVTIPKTRKTQMAPILNCPSNFIKQSLQCQQFHQKDYIFNGYKCDFCETYPIRNIRFHCNQCEDYDVCQKCYYSCRKSHSHDNFQRIDGQQLRDRAREKLLQSRDMNFKTSAKISLRKGKRNNTISINNPIDSEQF